jgi:hypothetical protein
LARNLGIDRAAAQGASSVITNAVPTIAQSVLSLGTKAAAGIAPAIQKMAGNISTAFGLMTLINRLSMRSLALNPIKSILQGVVLLIH